MNQFEKNIADNRNDLSDSIMGFIVSFGFFATLFIIATVIQFIGS